MTHGPYRWVRHPLYTVGTLRWLSIGLIAESWLIPALFVPLALFLSQRTKIEEAKLIERYGDEYRAYAERTGRYLPRISSGGGLGFFRSHLKFAPIRRSHSGRPRLHS